MTLPFAMPPSDVIFASPKKVFAHYFYPFPLQIDNVAPAVDYFNRNYLVPGGESGKFSKQGGYLRQRPQAQPNPTQTGYQVLNLQTEVRMAIARGITGFAVDILNLADALAPTGHLQSLFVAAQSVDPRFVVAPMLDMSALTGLTPAQGASIIQAIQNYPNVYRLWDGRLVIMAFNAVQPLAWWQSLITILNTAGIDVAFWPLLLGGPSDAGILDPISYGVGAWGTAIPTSAIALQAAAAVARTFGLRYLLPVLPQQFRPKDGVFWESSNSVAFRDAWLAAIQGDVDAVQLVTWSDFSESGQIQPYTDASLAPNIGTGFYNMNGYYATWFLTGAQPKITQDVLYYFYRKMQSNAAHPNQENGVKVISSTEESNIELVGFLTAPGTLVINGQNMAAPQGISSFKVPTAPGFPSFALQRNGSNVFKGEGPVQIYGPEGSPAGTLDLTYWSGQVG